MQSVSKHTYINIMYSVTDTKTQIIPIFSYLALKIRKYYKF